jgi:ABC-type transporter Mla MlaB component
MPASFHLMCVPPHARLDVRGELDREASGPLDAVLADAYLAGCTSVEIDLGAVSTIDVQASHVLHWQQRRLARAGGSLLVVAEPLRWS